MTDFPSYTFKFQAFVKYLYASKTSFMRSLPVQAFIENIALTPCGLGDLQSDTAATPWLFVAVRKLAYKSKDWKGFVALLLSKHMDEMLNSVLKMYWFTFSHKDRLFKRKTTTVTFTQKPKVRATGLLSLKRKRKGSVSLQSKVRYLFCYSIWLLSQYRDHQKSHERFA